MTYATAEMIVRNDPDFTASQYILARLMRLNVLSAEEQEVIERLYWSALTAAYIYGYSYRLSA